MTLERTSTGVLADGQSQRHHADSVARIWCAFGLKPLEELIGRRELQIDSEVQGAARDHPPEERRGRAAPAAVRPVRDSICKNALVAADMLNDKVVPAYEAHGIRLLRVLTDRGTEYCGRYVRAQITSSWDDAKSILTTEQILSLR